MKEGDRVRISVEEGKMVVEVVRDPIDLALHGKKFAKISAEEVERISLKEQSKTFLYNGIHIIKYKEYKE